MDTEITCIRELLLTAPRLVGLRPGRPAGDLLPLCQWTVAGNGLALIFTGLEPPILLTVGEPEDVADALVRAVLPEEVYLSVREEHLPAEGPITLGVITGAWCVCHWDRMWPCPPPPTN